jgi:branched-subunit amino acid transport protein
VDKSNFWSIIITLGIGTLCIRASFFFLYSYIKISPRIKKAFSFIPAAVLPALVIPSVVFHQGQVELFAGHERVIALLIATVVSYKTQSVLFTVVTGIASLFALNSLL